MDRTQPVIADIALGAQTIPKGQSVLEALRPSKEPGVHPSPVAEWFEATEAKPLVDAARNGGDSSTRRQGILRVRAADDVETRRCIEDVLETRAKRWTLESAEPGPDGLPALTCQVRLKKRRDWGELLDALQAQLAPQLAEKEADSTPGAPNQESG